MKFLKNRFAILSLLPLALTINGAFAAGTCAIKEVDEVKGSVRGYDTETRRSTIDVRDLDECVSTGRALLGKKTVGSHTFTRTVRHEKSRQTRRRTDLNANFTTVKVVLHYQSDEPGSRPVKVKFKYQ